MLEPCQSVKTTAAEDADRPYNPRGRYIYDLARNKEPDVEKLDSGDWISKDNRTLWLHKSENFMIEIKVEPTGRLMVAGAELAEYGLDDLNGGVRKLTFPCLGAEILLNKLGIMGMKRHDRKTGKKTSWVRGLGKHLKRD